MGTDRYGSGAAGAVREKKNKAKKGDARTIFYLVRASPFCMFSGSITEEIHQLSSH